MADPTTMSVEDKGLPSLSATRTFRVAMKPVALPVAGHPQILAKCQCGYVTKKVGELTKFFANITSSP